MTTYEVGALLLGSAGMVGSAAWVLYTQIRDLKNNHLKHIEDGVNRVETKLDNHIEYHLEHKL